MAEHVTRIRKVKTLSVNARSCGLDQLALKVKYRSGSLPKLSCSICPLIVFNSIHSLDKAKMIIGVTLIALCYFLPFLGMQEQLGTVIQVRTPNLITVRLGQRRSVFRVSHEHKLQIGR